MNELKEVVPSKMLELLERAGINTPKEVIILSNWDIKKVTNLSIEDISLLKNIVSEHIKPSIATCDVLTTPEKVPSGCQATDTILHGGFRKGTITEIYGESGSGKTQLTLQTVANSWPGCTIYICTEDLFPIKRFNEIRRHQTNYNPTVDYGSSTFVEHITESKDLLSCLRVRVPKLLSQNKFDLLVIDSVAAPFRVDSVNYVQRAEDMRELAMNLILLAQEFNLAVLCINQVTASFDDSEEMLPSLGLAWSNLVTTRLQLKKTRRSIKLKDSTDVCSIRELSIVFAPDLANAVAEFVVTSKGIEDLS